MNNTLIDNSSENLNMLKYLKECILNSDFEEIKIATGYWDIPGMALLYEEIKMFLERKNTSIQLLIGKEPLVRLYQQLNPQKRDDFPGEYIKKDIESLSLKDEYQNVVDLILHYCNNEDSKFQIRIYGQGEEEQFLHSKCYIFKGDFSSYGIIGSSNFTKKGLEDNAELNYLETDPLRVSSVACGVSNIKSHIMWFNEKWDQSEPWTKTFLEEILKVSPIGKKVVDRQKQLNNATVITPYEAYMKLLYNLWGEIIDGKLKSNIETFIPKDYMTLDYQIDAVNQGYAIMKKHGGFILSDVVGLGKTIVGILTVKRFISEAGNRMDRVLIVTPPAIKSSWINTINDFDKDNENKIMNHVTFVTTGSLANLLGYEEEIIDEDTSDDSLDIESASGQQYGLILVDESHKFRNSNTQMYAQLDTLIAQNYPQPYIVLITATPQNNSPEDLKNQIYLFQREHQNSTLDTIPGRRLDSYFNDKNKAYKELIKRKNIDGSIKKPEQLKADNEKLKKITNDIREKVIEQLVIRRTRKDIEEHYENDMMLQGLRFPKIGDPNELPYRMDERLSKLFFDTIEVITPSPLIHDSFYDGGLQYFRYRAIEFLIKKENRERYEKRNLTVTSTSRRLAHIMQILLVKRLESSFSAFRKSLKNLQLYTRNMIYMLQDNSVFICPDIDVNKIMGEFNINRKSEREKAYTIIRDKIENKQGNNLEFKASDFALEYIEGLQHDYELISELVECWQNETYDPKLNEFNDKLDSLFFKAEINAPSHPQEQKLVIFTEAIDTVNELKRHIEAKQCHKVLAITAANRNEMNSIIQANFDANYKGEWRNDYDILITTEVLAEGVNLHRSNVIVNYDTPWNSTRLMQRIGRVNRIGSREEYVHVFNFFPSKQGDGQIDLVKKAYTKLQAFHSLFGEDSKVFSHEEELVEHDFKKLNLEDRESPILQYITELKHFKDEHPDEYERIASLPDGCFAAKLAEKEGMLCHVKANFNGGLYFLIQQDQVFNISILEMMQRMQCLPQEPSESMPDNVEQMKESVLIEYQSYINRITTAKDQSKKQREALSLIVKMLRKNDANLSKDTIQILKLARQQVENQDMVLIRQIIEINKEIKESLFQDEESKIDFFEDLIQRRLSIIKKMAHQVLKEEPRIVLSMGLKQI